MNSQVRIQNLDAVRGIAVLGILAVNAVTFAWPMEAMMATQLLPMAVDNILPGPDRIAAWVNEALFTDKFRTLFCFLFGVSIFLIGGERSDKARGRLLRRRLFWLAIFGLFHGLAIWFGDILLLYAWAGLFVSLMRSFTAKVLLWVGGLITTFMMLGQIGTGLMMPMMAPDISGAIEGHANTTTADLLRITETVRSSISASFMQNLKSWTLVQGMSLTVLLVPVFGLMVLGMGLYKAGFFHGRLSNKIYLFLIAFGLAALALKGWAAWVESGVSPELLPSMGLNMVGSSFSVLIALAYASIIIKAPRLFRWAQPVGQMAFTTYLSQSLIMASLFYLPWGPKLYGQLGPAALWAVVLSVWIVQILFAHWWLKSYRWGPLEWLWRSLTQGQRLSLRRVNG